MTRHPAPSTAPQHADLRYGQQSARQTLDLYLPDAAEGGGPRPLVVFVHGGAWVKGDKAELAGETGAGHVRLLRALLDAGYAAASVNYRLAGEATFPAPFHDVRAATRFLRAHAGEYGLDPQRFAAAGASAGGHLAQLLGVVKGGELEQEHADMRASASVSAVVSYYGVSDLTRIEEQRAHQGCEHPESSPDEGEEALLGGPLSDPRVHDLGMLGSPITHVHRDAPPTLLLHGNQDCVVPTAQSLHLQGALQRAGVDARLQVIRAGHGDPAFHAPDVLRLVLDFLSEHV